MQIEVRISQDIKCMFKISFRQVCEEGEEQLKIIFYDANINIHIISTKTNSHFYITKAHVQDCKSLNSQKTPKIN